MNRLPPSGLLPDDAPPEVLRKLWNWLPAFRAVAETGGINRTALALGTSPSALSRMVKLLEEASGKQLFYRVRGRLVLTADGRRVLAAVQLATNVLARAFLDDPDANRALDDREELGATAAE